MVWLTEGAEVSVFADVKNQRAKCDRADPVMNGKTKRSSADRSDEVPKQSPLTPPGE